MKIHLASLLLIWAPMAAAGLFDEIRGNNAEFLPADEAFVLSAVATASDQVEARWLVAPGYYLYRHRLAFRVIEPGPGAVLDSRLPAGQAMIDEHFGEVEVYRDELTASVLLPVSLRGEELVLEVVYQGCAEAGLCYPPQTRQLPVKLLDPAP